MVVIGYYRLKGQSCPRESVEDLTRINHDKNDDADWLRGHGHALPLSRRSVLVVQNQRTVVEAEKVRYGAAKGILPLGPRLFPSALARFGTRRAPDDSAALAKVGLDPP
jgi:hypothetical protein